MFSHWFKICLEHTYGIGKCSLPNEVKMNASDSTRATTAGRWFFDCLVKNGIGGSFVYKTIADGDTFNFETVSVDTLQKRPEAEVDAFFRDQLCKFSVKDWPVDDAFLSPADLAALHKRFEGQDCFGVELENQLDKLDQLAPKSSFDQLYTTCLLSFCLELKDITRISRSKLTNLFASLAKDAVALFPQETEDFFKASYPEGLTSSSLGSMLKPSSDLTSETPRSSSILLVDHTFFEGCFSGIVRFNYLEKFRIGASAGRFLTIYSPEALLGLPHKGTGSSALLEVPQGLSIPNFIRDILVLADAHLRSFEQIKNAPWSHRAPDRIKSVKLAEGSLKALAS